MISSVNSTSSSIITAAFDPNSNVTRFNPAFSLIPIPTFGLPVKVMEATSLFLTIASPTVFPAAIAGPTLCATKFNGKLNGVIAPITPIGFRIVYAIRPSAPGAASSGNVSPYIRFAS